MAGKPELHNEIASTVTGHVVQAGRIEGGLSFHSPGRAPVVPRQLPATSGQFTGRSAELAVLTNAFDIGAQQGTTVVISALGGAGGIGKTWLALHWAHQHMDRFPDGQLFVDLRGFDPTEQPMEPREAIRGFLDALGIAPEHIPAEESAQSGLYRTLVAERRMLIVLDNARDSEQVAPLLPGSASCTVVVTSRDQLAGLVTRHSARPITVDVLSEEDSRELLSLRLGPERLTAEPSAVAELVRWCAGLPLALSIVAGRATLRPHIPLAELAAELRDASSRLGALDVGEPSTGLNAVLSWSYRALAPEQAMMFGMLGLAPGSDISLTAAANLMGFPKGKASSILQALERISLVQQHVTGRYRMHDLVRLYATEQANLDQSQGEIDRALIRLVDFCCHTAHAADLLIAPHHAPIELRKLEAGCSPHPLPDKGAAWAWFDAERANLMDIQALAARKRWHSEVWQLAWTLTTFHLRQGHLHDNHTAWKVGAEASKHLNDPHTRTRSHRHLGRACAQLGRHAEALTHLQEGLAGAELDGDVLGQAHTHRALAVAWEHQGNDQRALEHSRAALRLYEELGVPISGSHALNEVGWYTAKLGDYARAREQCTEALARCRANESRSGEAKTLTSLGYIAHHTGDTDRAVHHYQQALALYQALGDTSAEAGVLDRLGDAFALVDIARAREAWQRACELYEAQNRAGDVQRIRQQLEAQE
ncbi:ATP-binding protein [Allokutzneria albata]|uniref:Tetratricopeptide repeat-containing protein n=1 Tax=Allokutzneria albata TaxID=211114 RepID=A0A1G9S7R7_ALLAB|nr:tetratricopeptide repeat protein [Allokutzneria albata]SDM31472.1 Tetratricopeptide repeat-containing protein [Allokutzneria albata]